MRNWKKESSSWKDNWNQGIAIRKIKTDIVPGEKLRCVQMAKTKETLLIEQELIRDTREKRIYGCEEVTIGFYGNGHGNEAVDFITMDSKGILKCYEIKVSLQDLRSDAKLSWYGHYNYLIVTRKLWDQSESWTSRIPGHIGIIVADFYEGTSRMELTSARKAKKMDIGHEMSEMLKESLVRSLYWKLDKNRSAKDVEKMSRLKKECRIAEEQKKKAFDEAERYHMMIRRYERAMKYNHGVDFDLEKESEREYALYQKRRWGDD